MGKETIQKFYQKNKRVVVGSAVAVLAVAVIGVTVAQQQAHAATESARAELNQHYSTGRETLKQAQGLLDKQQEFLVKDMTQEKLDEVMKLASVQFSVADKHKDKLSEEIKEVSAQQAEIQELTTKAQGMFDTQNEVNSLFTKVVMNGSEVGKDPIVKKDIDTKLLEQLEQTEEQTAFDKKVLDVSKTARVQVNDIENARKSLENATKDKSEKNVEDTQKAIDTIKNPDVKKELQDKLNPLKQEVAEKKKAEEEKQAQEALQQQQASGEVVSAEIVSNDSTGVNNGYVGKSSATGDYAAPVSENAGGAVSTPPVNSGGGAVSNPTPNPAPNHPQTPAPAPSSPPASSNNGGGQAPAPSTPPPVQTRYRAWVSHKTNGIIYLGTFNSQAEARQVADDYYMANWINENGDTVLTGFGTDTFG